MTTPPDRPLVPPSPQGWPVPPAQPFAAQGHPAAGAQAPGWGPLPQYPGWSPQPSDPESAQALRSARTAMGWAIGAAVGAGLSLVLTLVLLVTGLGGTVPEDGYYAETLRGQVTGLSEGSPLGGDRLEQVLGGLLDDYGIDHDIQCPDTATVTVSTVVVCRGDVDGYEWTGVVVLEDDEGSFAVVEL